MRIKKSIRVGRVVLNFRFELYYKKGVETIGIYDLCKDSKHVIFLDYDNFRYEWIIDELRYIQKRFRLSDFYLFESSEGSYHAVCFDKVSNYELHKILQHTNIDESFYSASFWDYGSRVLRLFPKGKKDKPHFIYHIKSKWHKREKSLDHIKVFKHNYDIDINSTNAKELGQVWMIKYKTEHNVGR